MVNAAQVNGAAAQAELPKAADVVVIGGGVNGASTAFQLAKRGQRVVLVEQGQLGYGATGKSGALVRCHYANVPESHLTLESLRVFRNWGDLVGQGSPVFEATGFLQVVGPNDVEKLRANVAAQQAIGVETVIVTPDEAKEIEPLLYTDDIGLLAFEPHSGFADPNATLYGFAAAAQAHGAVIATQTLATRIVTEGDRVVGVETARGTIATETVVLAGGAWANSLLGPLGVDLGLKPRRVQVIVFRWPAAMDQGRRHRVVIDAINHSWLRPEGVAGTIVGIETHGGTDEPEGYDQTPDAEYLRRAHRALANRLPIFEHATMRGGWAGMIMGSPDDHPLIGAIDAVPGLYVMAGDNGTSFKTSPAIGICLAELITEGEAKLVDLTPFRPSRIAEGQLWRDQYEYATGEVSTVSR